MHDIMVVTLLVEMAGHQGGMAAPGVQKLLGVSRDKTYRLLEEMVDNGLIEKHRMQTFTMGGVKQYYTITPAGEAHVRRSHDITSRFVLKDVEIMDENEFLRKLHAIVTKYYKNQEMTKWFVEDLVSLFKGRQRTS